MLPEGEELDGRRWPLGHDERHGRRRLQRHEQDVRGQGRRHVLLQLGPEAAAAGDDQGGAEVTAPGHAGVPGEPRGLRRRPGREAGPGRAARLQGRAAGPQGQHRDGAAAAEHHRDEGLGGGGGRRPREKGARGRGRRQGLRGLRHARLRDPLRAEEQRAAQGAGSYGADRGSADEGGPGADHRAAHLRPGPGVLGRHRGPGALPRRGPGAHADRLPQRQGLQDLHGVHRQMDAEGAPA
mmetsp:Transcript_51087/g.150638  ORF Transcript_51087/g.150638 Transcript_51087/m.150638 type:complete len:239 (+) Transcript_51087:147-863(+)